MVTDGAITLNCSGALWFDNASIGPYTVALRSCRLNFEGNRLISLIGELDMGLNRPQNFVYKLKKP